MIMEQFPPINTKISTNYHHLDWVTLPLPAGTMGAQATIQGNSSHLDVVVPQIYIFHIYTWPKFTQIPNLHGTQIYTNPDLHGTHIYTAQIYTNPFPHIDSKKPKFTQPKFTQNPNLHNPTLHITQNFFFKFCFLCGYTSNAARGKRLQGRSLFWTNQGLINL